jgi:hypothetical protein
MNVIFKLLAILGMQILLGCSNMNANNSGTQATGSRSVDLHNVIVPIYHKDL